MDPCYGFCHLLVFFENPPKRVGPAIFEKPPHVVDFFATAVVLVLGNPPRAISSNRLGIDKVKSNSGGPKEGNLEFLAYGEFLVGEHRDAGQV